MERGNRRPQIKCHFCQNVLHPPWRLGVFIDWIKLVHFWPGSLVWCHMTDWMVQCLDFLTVDAVNTGFLSAPLWHFPRPPTAKQAESPLGHYTTPGVFRKFFIRRSKSSQVISYEFKSTWILPLCSVIHLFSHEPSRTQLSRTLDYI